MPSWVRNCSFLFLTLCAQGLFSANGGNPGPDVNLSSFLQGELGELGKVLMQGSFSVWVGHRKGPTKMKDLARFKPMQRHLFLYEKALVFCKKREEHCDSYDKRSSYSFKHFLKVRKR